MYIGHGYVVVSVVGVVVVVVVVRTNMIEELEWVKYRENTA